MEKFRQNVFRDLRVELGHLKTCQNAAIAVGITGAGVVLGLVRESPAESQSALIFLPLLVLFPFWLVFFDKAKTVARIVGFIRVQEFLLFAQSNYGGIGWESALGKYWEKKPLCEENRYIEEDIKALSEQLRGLKKVVQTIKRISYKFRVVVKSTYLTTVYGIFFIFSLLLISSGLYFSGFPRFIITILSIFTLLNFFLNYTFYNDDLDYPQYSYYLFIDGALCFFLMLLPILFGTFPYLFDWVFSLVTFSWLSDHSLIVLLRSILGQPPVQWPNGLSVDSVKIIVTAGGLIGFAYFTTLTYWILTNLLYGRYTANSFVRRWEVVLNLKLDMKRKIVEYRNWEGVGIKKKKLIFERALEYFANIFSNNGEVV